MQGLGDLVKTQDGSFTLRHPLYNEEFHAIQGARTEARELYIQGSGYQARLTEPQSRGAIAVLDLGLGLGYNAMMTIECWWQSPGLDSLTMLSLEHSEELLHALVDPSCPWKADWSREWRIWSSALRRLDKNLWAADLSHPKTGKKLRWLVQIGDASQVAWIDIKFDFIWQDAFSPKKNPELWTQAWFAKLKECSQPHTCLMSYSVARIVKDNLLAAGWGYTKLKASHTKKEWLKAYPAG